MLSAMCLDVIEGPLETIISIEYKYRVLLLG